jgi:thiamine-monophosphate kinase
MDSTKNKRTPIGRFGKFGLIEHLIEGISSSNKSTVSIIGDDAAMVDNKGKLTLISTDLLLEGIHFNLVYTPLKHLGYKAVIRAISDIYAMNGIPAQILVAIGISKRFAVEQIDEIYEGIKLACDKYKVDLAGGDISSSVTGLAISVTGIGNAGRDEVVRRDGGKPNDLIFVTGNFGASFMGLQVLEREKRLFDKDKEFSPDLSGYEYIIGRQLKPEFPAGICDLIRRSEVLPSAMIDVSDGLASDLLHICFRSGTGCRIFYDRIPVDAEAFRTAEEFGMDPVIPALNGGEDYELLFTVPLEEHHKINDIPGIRMIGHLTAPGQGHIMVTEEGGEIELGAQGWEKAED